MYRKIQFILLLIFISTWNLHAQDPNFSGYGKIDRHAKRAPDSICNNLTFLHKYLVSAAETDEEKIRAFYIWIIKNIKYKDQIELKYNSDVLFYMGSNNCSSPVCVLGRKQAVCEGFSKIFEYFCQQSGIEAYSIGGYISKNGVLQDRATHSWNLLKINGTWRFFDLSWAYATLRYTGIKSSTNEFFMVEPEQFILTHLPLIPMWQVLESPITIETFNQGDSKILEQLASAPQNYSFTDSIAAFKLLPQYKKRLKTADEIFKTNPSNKFNRAIEYYRFAQIAVNFDGEITPLIYYKLIRAQEKIKVAIDLFQTCDDISSKIMYLHSKDHLKLINRLLDSASSDIIYLK